MIEKEFFQKELRKVINSDTKAEGYVGKYLRMRLFSGDYVYSVSEKHSSSLTMELIKEISSFKSDEIEERFFMSSQQFDMLYRSMKNTGWELTMSYEPELIEAEMPTNSYFVWRRAYDEIESFTMIVRKKDGYLIADIDENEYALYPGSKASNIERYEISKAQASVLRECLSEMKIELLVRRFKHTMDTQSYVLDKDGVELLWKAYFEDTYIICSELLKMAHVYELSLQEYQSAEKIMGFLADLRGCSTGDEMYLTGANFAEKHDVVIFSLRDWLYLGRYAKSCKDGVTAYYKVVSTCDGLKFVYDEERTGMVKPESWRHMFDFNPDIFSFEQIEIVVQ